MRWFDVSVDEQVVDDDRADCLIADIRREIGEHTAAGFGGTAFSRGLVRVEHI